ncbi:hypothetical protein L1987_50585 [Smallanthus sonchifolius]|uniref:Uncharacterized protein n=1 Tax=Smallanthus sonchifolius TaxID=185202 RepID=A0ACB9EMG0_9ASTR|nr:hypothetical protein L1987_50585 [Smallanthus sonchifolius]
MNRSRRQGKDEVFDFLKPSTTKKRSTTIRPSTKIRPPAPKLAEPTPKPVQVQASATTSSPNVAAPLAIAQTRPLNTSHMTPCYPNPISFKSVPPQSTPFSPLPMAPTKPSTAVTPPPAPVSPQSEDPSKAPAYPPAHANDPSTSSNNSGAMLEPHVKDQSQRYVEVSELLKSGEVRGIVNPSQLASFLNRKPKDK